MKKLLSIIAFLVWLSITSVFAQETITITSYYPAPYGVYNNMRLFPGAQPVCAAANDEGVMYFDSGTHQLMVCKGDGTGHFTWQNAGGLWKLVTPANGSTPYIFPNSNNWNVGIGTSTPQAKLNIRGDNDSLMLTAQTAASEYTGITFYPYTGYTAQFTYTGGIRAHENYAGRNVLELWARDGDVEITYGNGAGTPNNFLVLGNVGIKTQTPQQALDVNGAIRIGPGGGGIHSNLKGNYGGKETVYTTADGVGGDKDEIWIGPNTNNYKGHIQLVAENIEFNTHGNTGTPPGLIQLTAHKINMATNGGTVVVDGTTVHNSDFSLKKDIVTIPNALERVSKLRGVNFHWKNKESEQGLQMGLIAQETEKEFPEVVYTGKDGKKSIAYAQLMGALVESIKELDSRVKELKKDNDSLKRDNVLLKETVEELKTKLK